MSIGKVTFTHNFLNESKKKSFRINEHPSVLRAQIIAPCESMNQISTDTSSSLHHNFDI
jgi:hypothetical protein